MGPMPDLPATRFCHMVAMSSPTGEITPMPVMTIRLASICVNLLLLQLGTAGID